MVVLLSQLQQIIPSNKEPDQWLIYINRLTPKYHIDTDWRLIGFLSQSAHESNEFSALTENLNYSAQRLCEIWPKRFPSLSFAQQYHRNPMKIANYVYADRMGNGNVASGDGWKFRGRGIKQLTGRDNYTSFANDIGKTVEEAVVYAGTKEGAVETACWFWNKNNLNHYADKQDIVGLTKAINGGMNGYGQREYYWAIAKKALKDKLVDESKTSSLVLYPIGYGDKNSLVQLVQQNLGISADGDFGRGTQQAVRTWQKSKGYPVSGSLTIKQLEDLLNV